MNLDLEKDIVETINAGPATFCYDLPYVLLVPQMERIEALIENAPLAYSMEIKESPCFSSGIFLLFKRLE